MLIRVHASNLVAFARNHPEVVVFSGDLTSSCEIDTFRNAFPARFFSMGLTEQNMMSMAGGMAREGYTPFVHTFAVFMYRRALDQIEMSIAYPNLPVRMFGFLPGVTTPGGATHQAIDDLGVLRSLPNMTILETGDATDVESVLDVAQGVDGPVYIRMVRGQIPRLFAASQPMKFREARVLSEGDDITLLTSGISTEEAMRVTHLVAQASVGITHLHITTLKPFDDPTVKAAIARSKHGVITMENHSILGGLGTAVAEMIAVEGLNQKLTRIGIPDTYIHGASKAYLMREYKLDALALLEAMEAHLNQRFGITDQDLSEVRLTEFYSKDQQEAL
jgi:transketolase